MNESFAKAYFAGTNPIGRWFEKQQEGNRHIRIRIVGLVRDARYRNMREPITPTAYLPFAPAESAAFLVRTTAANPATLAPVIRREIPFARPEFRVDNIRTQQEINARQTIRERLLAALAMFFAIVALLLAAVGLYGVLDYSVQQRRREIATRLAVGAPTHIVRLLISGVFVMVCAGAAAGLALGMASIRYIEALLYQVQPRDPGMLALPAAALLAAALLAALPAIVRAVRIDPATVLRAD